MRVAIISETFLPKVDGIVKVACLLLDHLSQRGIEALVIAPRYGDGAQLQRCAGPQPAEPVVPAVSGGAPRLRHLFALSRSGRVPAGCRASLSIR